MLLVSFPQTGEKPCPFRPASEGTASRHFGLVGSEMPMRILVTGVSGYVGAALVPRLRAAATTCAASRARAARVTAAGRRHGPGRRRDRRRPRPRARRRRRGVLPDPLDGGRGAGAFAEHERRSAEHVRRGRGRAPACGASSTSAGSSPRTARSRATSPRGSRSRSRCWRPSPEAIALRASIVDRRPLALVPLPRAPDRAAARAGPAGLARQPHRADRRPRRARVPGAAPRRRRRSSPAGRGTSRGPDVMTYGE